MSQDHTFVSKVFADKAELGTFAAQSVAQRLRSVVEEKGSARLIVATGASQYEFLDAFRTQNVPWDKITVFHLDEYVNLPEDHAASFRKYLKERLFNHVSFASVNLLNGNATPDEECSRYEKLLQSGPIDVACIGIGENGHLAFNDPPADFNTSKLVHVVTLDEKCRQQQVGEGHFAGLENVPKQALSLSMPGILRAKYISCVVPDERKAQAVKDALEGPIDPKCPASALRLHGDVCLLLDKPSASKLSWK